MMLEYIREIDTTKWISKQKNNIKQYKGEPGVWILLGKKRGDTRFECLQVGQTKTGIGDEIEIDISYLTDENTEPTIGLPTEEYINQFGECMFLYEKHMGRRKMLYKEISKKYDDLTFICVAHEKSLRNQPSLLMTIEKYVAFKTLCRYWANGRPYNKKSSKEIEIIKKRCVDECPKLFEEIKDQYPEMANSLNEFLDKLIIGDIDSLIIGK